MNDDAAIIELVELLFNWKLIDKPKLRWNQGGGSEIDFRPDHNDEHVTIVLNKMVSKGHSTFHFEFDPDGDWLAYFDPEKPAHHSKSWKHAMVCAAINALRQSPGNTG